MRTQELGVRSMNYCTNPLFFLSLDMQYSLRFDRGFVQYALHQRSNPPPPPTNAVRGFPVFPFAAISEVHSSTLNSTNFLLRRYVRGRSDISRKPTVTTPIAAEHKKKRNFQKLQCA